VLVRGNVEPEAPARPFARTCPSPVRAGLGQRIDQLVERARLVLPPYLPTTWAGRRHETPLMWI